MDWERLKCAVVQRTIRPIRYAVCDEVIIVSMVTEDAEVTEGMAHTVIIVLSSLHLRRNN